MILGTHYAGLLGKMLVGKELVRAGSHYAELGRFPLHSLNSFETRKYFKDFIKGFYAQNNLPAHTSKYWWVQINSDLLESFGNKVT